MGLWSVDLLIWFSEVCPQVSWAAEDLSQAQRQMTNPLTLIIDCGLIITHLFFALLSVCLSTQSAVVVSEYILKPLPSSPTYTKVMIHIIFKANRAQGSLRHSMSKYDCTFCFLFLFNITDVGWCVLCILYIWVYCVCTTHYTSLIVLLNWIFFTENNLKPQSTSNSLHPKAPSTTQLLCWVL